jgi:uncharacterized protein (TIGR02391 family)
MPLSNDAQMWADRTYAKNARAIEKEYQEKLAQFAGGLIRREDVEARKGTYGYIDERIQASKSKAEKKAEILQQAYERDRVSLSSIVIDEILICVGSLLEGLNSEVMITEAGYLEDPSTQTRADEDNAERLSEIQNRLIKSWVEVTREIREHLEISLADHRLRQKDLPRKEAVPVIGPYSLHSDIERVSGTLYRDGHFREAVANSFIQVIEAVKNKSGLPSDGDDLMNRAFACEKGRVPVVQLNSLKSDADIDEQRGFLFLFKGIVQLRNKKAHVIENLADPSRAHDYLALASLLMRLLDIAVVTGTP